MKVIPVTKVIDGKRYNTETADLIASDDWWDGSNYERRGTNTFLFRTKKGAYFFYFRSQWQGAADCSIEVATRDEALSFWEQSDRHGEAVSFEEAFPGVKVEEA